MQINVSGHQVEVTSALRGYVESKFDRILRHFDQLHDVGVTLAVDKLTHSAEATIRAAAGKTIHAEAIAPDMYAAIDALSDKLDGQIRKHKEKLTDHHKVEAQRATRMA
jgi:putative sigma-54 modulation protein